VTAKDLRKDINAGRKLRTGQTVSKKNWNRIWVPAKNESYAK
jgi:hypothetical protein